MPLPPDGDPLLDRAAAARRVLDLRGQSQPQLVLRLQYPAQRPRELEPDRLLRVSPHLEGLRLELDDPPAGDADLAKRPPRQPAPHEEAVLVGDPDLEHAVAGDPARGQLQGDE